MYEGGKQSGGGGVGIRFKERDFFNAGKIRVIPDVGNNRNNAVPSSTNVSNDEMVNSKPSVDLQHEMIMENRLMMANLAVIEFLASLFLVFSTIYVPDSDSDILKQYVSSAAIIAVMVGFKDRRYFFPDGTIMVTAVLVCSGVYNAPNGFHVAEISMRLVGQIAGFLVIFFGVAYVNPYMFKYGAVKFEYVSSSGSVMAINEINRAYCELVGTFVEGIVVSFAVVPLIKPDPQRSIAFIVKPEALPPKIKDLWYAAFCVGLVHYVLERVFRVTMNPFITIMHAWLENNPLAYFRLLGQFAGLIFACLYCYYFRPTPSVYKVLYSG